MTRLIVPILLAILLHATSAASAQTLVATSDGAFATEALALESARESAAARLATLLGSQRDASIPPAFVRPVIDDGSLVRQSRVHRQDKPYGSIYTAELTIDASPGALEPLASAWQAERSAREERTLVRMAAIGALVVSVLLVYGVCSTLTRGWFAWPLRVVATVVLAVAAGAILA
jgi:hypothetical protein